MSLNDITANIKRNKITKLSNIFVWGFCIVLYTRLCSQFMYKPYIWMSRDEHTAVMYKHKHIYIYIFFFTETVRTIRKIPNDILIQTLKYWMFRIVTYFILSCFLMLSSIVSVAKNSYFLFPLKNKTETNKTNVHRFYAFWRKCRIYGGLSNGSEKCGFRIITHTVRPLWSHWHWRGFCSELKDEYLPYIYICLRAYSCPLVENFVGFEITRFRKPFWGTEVLDNWSSSACPLSDKSILMRLISRYKK